MTDEERLVVERLVRLAIPYQRYQHPPVTTVAEAEAHWSGIDATHCKNLFLRNQRGDRHYLVVLPHDKRADLRRLAESIGDGKLSFASPERLRALLGVTPGAVSPLALANDSSRDVNVFIDGDLREATRVTFHPSVNTATVVIAFSDFERYLADCGHSPRFIDVRAS